MCLNSEDVKDKETIKNKERKRYFPVACGPTWGSHRLVSYVLGGGWLA